ncbi:MAG: hypothetical protein AAB869_02905 [Patescibacteria group bacterium]
MLFFSRPLLCCRRIISECHTLFRTGLPRSRSIFAGSLRSTSRRNFNEDGFSTVELIVAVGIFLILTVTFLFNYSSFNGRVTVDMLAHQIATWVHDAQVSAMSVRRSHTSISPQEQFRSGYGLYFDLATPNKFVYFADLDRNRVYTPLVTGKKCGDPSVECEQEITLLQGNVVSLICGDKPLAAEPANCVSAVPGNPLLFTTNTLNIVFVRPDPFTASVWGDINTAYSHAEITVTSPKGYSHTITVWITGQVSVR